MLFCVRSTAQLQQYAGDPEPLLPGTSHLQGRPGAQRPRRRPCGAGAARAGRYRGRRPPARDAPRARELTRQVRVALVTPFAWSQPHDVNEHVDGLGRELRRRGHIGDRAGALEPRPRPGRRPACAARLLRRAAGADRHRTGRPDLPAQPDGSSGRRAREPLARTRARPLRRRARLRTRPAEPLVPRAPRLRGADGRNVLSPDRLGYPPAARSARSCWRASTRSSPRAERSQKPRTSASPAATSSCPTGSIPSCSRRQRSGSLW